MRREPFKRYLLAVLPLAASLAAAPVGAGEGQGHWSYTGEIGPEYWGDISEEFASCRVGRNQSPIDLRKADTIEADLKPLQLHYDVKTTEIVNNGHTLQVNVEKGAYLEAEGQRFDLLQFHMHAPSEHTVEGKHYPLELHFVHSNAAGELAVLGLLFKQGDHNPSIRNIQEIAPEKGATRPLVEALNQLFSRTELESYYRYNGSLTTPPCTEGLRWYVYPAAITVSREQIQRYTDLIGKDARPTQPVNARFVLFADD